MLIIGIAGGTGSGKTTVVKKIIESLPPGEVVLLPQVLSALCGEYRHLLLLLSLLSSNENSRFSTTIFKQIIIFATGYHA